MVEIQIIYWHGFSGEDEAEMVEGVIRKALEEAGFEISHRDSTGTLAFAKISFEVGKKGGKR